MVYKRRLSTVWQLLVLMLALQGCATTGGQSSALANDEDNEALLLAVDNHAALIALYRLRLADAVSQPEQDDNRLKLAKAYLASGDPESALFYCEEIITAGRNPGDCLLVKSRALLASGHHAEALAAGKEALEFFPDDVVVLNQLGLVYADAGDYEQARAQFNRARALLLDDVTARNNLAMVDILEHHWNDAAERLLPLFRSGQADEQVIANLLLALARSGREQEFIAVCGRKGQTCLEYYHALSGAGRKGGQ